MNVFDRMIAIINPVAGVRREVARAQMRAIGTITASGYDQAGASRVKQSLKGWTALSKSPQEDIDYNLNTLRQRSRDLFMSSPLGTSAIRTSRTNVVGPGLHLKSRVKKKRLGLSDEQAAEWEEEVESEFALWAESKWCDAQRLNNFYELQQILYLAWLMNGEGISLVKQADPMPWMPYGLRLHLIEGDRLSTPGLPSRILPGTTVAKNNDTGNLIYNGIEVDKSGGVVAYFVSNQYPNSIIKGLKMEWERIEAFGTRTGNPNILHVFDQDRCEQYRGVPYLAPVIETLKQITRYTEAELTAAVVQSFFTAFIKMDKDATDNPFNVAIDESERIQSSGDDPVSYEMGPGTVNMLGPGEDVELADPKRPASGFGPFVEAMARQIGAALEIPYELLMKSFTSSYSASRASLLEAWKAFKMRRTWFANDFCQPVYELWLSEAVARGRIKAPGFFNDPAIKAAWCGADWIGPAQGMLDPVKEVQAAAARVDRGFSTHERETTELTGGNWDENIGQIARERKLLAEIAPAAPTIEQGGKQNA